MKDLVSKIVMGIGLVLVAVGLFTPVPGVDLTTYKSLDGEESYSYIEKYVGGDAYNFIIGANLVGARISGTKVVKSVYISGGLVIFSIGLIAFAFSKEPVLLENNKEESKEDLQDDLLTF